MKVYALFRSFTCRRKTNEFRQVKFKDADKCLFLKDDHAENFGDFQVEQEDQPCFFSKKIDHVLIPQPFFLFYFLYVRPVGFGTGSRG